MAAPTQYGRRLMVSIIEEEAQTNPDRVFAWIPLSTDIQHGFRPVTFQQINRAVDYAVHWLQDGFTAFSLHETVGYVGVPDLRYNIFFYAALKLRLKVFLPSPRNPPSTNASLLEQTQCTKLVYSPEVAPVIKTLRGVSNSLHCLEFPTLDELWNAESTPVPYTLNFSEAQREPILILHSSGSTGLPKPITMTHGSFAILDNDRNFPSIPGRRNHDLTTWDFPAGSCLYVPFPPFHLAGFFNNIMVPIYTETVPVFGPPTRLPSGALVAHIIRSLNVRGCFLPPTLTAELYNEPDGVELLKSLDVLCYAGGPLSETIGNELVQHVQLCQFYGATEVGLVRQLFPPKTHWQYMEFHPLSRVELQPADDDAFELVIFADKETEKYSALNHNLPGVSEYRTKDLFRKHPTEPGLWKFHARRDDILVLSNGEKFNPIPLEVGVEAVPGVAGAVIAGQGQSRVALLVELRPDHGLGSDPVERLWPYVSKLNADTAGPGRVSKSMILAASTGKPFIRAGKGTVVRKLTLKAFETELDALFKDSREQGSQESKRRLLKPTAFRLADVQELVHSIIQDALYGQNDGDNLDDSQDFYSQGLDSVKSLEVISQLKGGLEGQQQASLAWLKPDILYTYPSVHELSVILLQWLNEGISPKQVDRVTKMKELLTRYENALPVAPASADLHEESYNHNDGDSPLNVVIVGSTGYLGQYLLSSFVQDPGISRVICLNRSARARERWATHLSSNEGISSIDSSWENKVSFYQVHFTKPEFGLQENIFNEVQEACDVIVHPAWQVNFALPLDAFGDSLNGLLNSIKLAAFSKRRARLLFISSVSATGVFSPPGSSAQKLVPEDVVNNANEAIRLGYGESKHVAEHLVYAASAKSGVAASVLRIGLIAPTASASHKIVWPPSDSLTVLLRVSKNLQMVPSDVVDVDWLPVNTVVDIVQKVLHNDHSIPVGGTPRFYNLVNPVSTAWSEVVPVIQQWCSTSSTHNSSGVTVKPFREWLESARSASQEQQDLLQMLGFFELLTERGPWHRYSQENVIGVCGQTIDIRPIDCEQMQKWLAALA